MISSLNWIESSLSCSWLNSSKICQWEQFLITIGMWSSGYVTGTSVWWLLESEIKVSMILVLLSSKSGWLSCCLPKVWVVILRLRGGMEVFLLEEDIIIKSTNYQEAGAGAGRVRNNSLLLTEESNYRLYVECLCLQRRLPSHLI